MKLGWKTRVGLVLSAVWLCLVFLVSDEYQRIGQVLGLGILPLVVIWGVVWAISGWRAQRPEKAPVPESIKLEAKGKRVRNLRVLGAVVVVLLLGLFAATIQFKVAGNEAGGHEISYWLGEWLVYGFFVYLTLRLVPKLPSGVPAVLAAIVVVGGVNFKAFNTIAEDQQTLSSLAKAMPLIQKIQSGQSIEEQEIRAANVGVLEPFVLAEAANTRELLAVAEAYQRAVSGLQPELLLTPASLASPSIRIQSRNKLKLFQLATSDYKTQLDMAIARGKLVIQAAESQMPKSIAGSFSKGFDKASMRLSDYVETLVETERDGSKAISGILDLLDANPGSYVVDKGPPASLVFRNEGVLAAYNELMSALMDSNKRQQEAHAKLIQAQIDQSKKLGSLFKH